MSPTEHQNLEQHAWGVDDQAYPGVRRIFPLDADLDDPQSRALCEPDQLDIKGEAPGDELTEEIPSDIAIQKLEPALRVADSPDPAESQDPVEGLAHPFAVQDLKSNDPRIR